MNTDSDNFSDLVFDTGWFSHSSAKTKVNDVIKDFLSIQASSYNERINIFEKKYDEFVLRGGTRVVIPVHQFIIKFSRTKSAPENKNEINVSKCLGELAPFILDYDKQNFHWIVVERLNTNENTIKEKAKQLFPKIDDKQMHGIFNPFSMTSITALRPNQKFDFTYNRLKAAASPEGEEWLEKFFNGIKKCKVNTSDMQWFNWGVSTFTGELIPIDFG